jgi:predicted HD phosphohydrolase
MKALSMDTVDQIEELFALHGHGPSHAREDGALSVLAHALQCAQLAQWAEASPALVAAALLHDIGHLIAPLGAGDADELHELRALGLLTGAFDRDVIEPIRLHVAAKRYLAAVDARYLPALGAAASRRLAMQGGAMKAEEAREFEARPFAAQAVALRRWDDLANEPGRRTPPLAYYIDWLQGVRRQPLVEAKRRVGASDVS